MEEECVHLKGKQHFCLNSISEIAVFLSNLHMLLLTLVASSTLHLTGSQAVQDSLQ